MRRSLPPEITRVLSRALPLMVKSVVCEGAERARRNDSPRTKSQHPAPKSTQLFITPIHVVPTKNDRCNVFYTFIVGLDRDRESQEQCFFHRHLRRYHTKYLRIKIAFFISRALGTLQKNSPPYSPPPPRPGVPPIESRFVCLSSAVPCVRNPIYPRTTTPTQE